MHEGCRQLRGNGAAAEAAWLVAAAGFGGGIALIGQMYHLSGDELAAILTWCAGTSRCWMNRAAPEERYRAGASDHADLERRMREIERANRGPALITFNH